MRLLRAADYPAAPWRNGGGVTREIAAVPAPEGQGFLWRLSLAEIAADGPFSRFPGVDRTLTLVEGAILLGGTMLDNCAAPFRFAGEAELDCFLLPTPNPILPTFVRPELVEGLSPFLSGVKGRTGLRQAQPERDVGSGAPPVLALNIMTLRGRCDHHVERIEGEGERSIAPSNTGPTFLFAVTGDIRANEKKLERHDTLQLLTGDAPVVVRQGRAARAVLVTVRAAPPQWAAPPA